MFHTLLSEVALQLELSTVVLAIRIVDEMLLHRAAGADDGGHVVIGILRGVEPFVQAAVGIRVSVLAAPAH